MALKVAFSAAVQDACGLRSARGDDIGETLPGHAAATEAASATATAVVSACAPPLRAGALPPARSPPGRRRCGPASVHAFPALSRPAHAALHAAPWSPLPLQPPVSCAAPGESTCAGALAAPDCATRCRPERCRSSRLSAVSGRLSQVAKSLDCSSAPAEGWRRATYSSSTGAGKCKPMQAAPCSPMLTRTGSRAPMQTRASGPMQPHAAPC
eukprot:353238-Chlamydomonas_euryale.AAC.4